MALFRFQSAENFAVAVDETIRTVKWLFRRRTLDLYGFQWRELAHAFVLSVSELRVKLNRPLENDRRQRP